MILQKTNFVMFCRTNKGLEECFDCRGEVFTRFPFAISQRVLELLSSRYHYWLLRYDGKFVAIKKNSSEKKQDLMIIYSREATNITKTA